MLTAEQLEMRKKGLGGSEIAAVLGESRFATPFDVWLSKTQGWRTEETEDMRRGSFLEDGIARWYASRYGIEGQLTEPGTMTHATRPLALCTPDRIVGGLARRLVSIKAPRRGGDLWGEPGTDHVPPEHLLQLQWEHAICSSHGALADEMHLAALVDGDLAVYITQADRELQAWMLDYAEQWWARHVVGGEQPSMDGSGAAHAWLKRKFPRDQGEERAATTRETRLLVELQLAEREAKTWAGEVDTLTNELRLSMGAAARIESPAGVATWKADKNGKRSFRTKWTNKEK